MMNKTFSVGSLTLRFESEKPIPDSRFFSAFLSDGTPDVSVPVVSGALPEKKGELIFAGERASLYETKAGDTMLFSSYFDNALKRQYEYACLRKTANGYCLTVDDSTGLRDSMLVNAVGLPRFLLERGEGILHSSFVVFDGEAVLFIGESGIGKTTQARLWEKYRGALLVNGDRCILSVKNGVLTAYGIPFCGSSDVSLNVSAPVKAIVVLSQASVNTAGKQGVLSAFNAVLSCFTYEPRDPFESRKAGDLAMDVVNTGRVYSLACTPDERAVKALEEELWRT